ncbi:MAG: hypothetical protein WBR26_11580 [Candidatus Acidiferrum sp.]
MATLFPWAFPSFWVRFRVFFLRLIWSPTLVLHNLPLADERSVRHTEINLVSQSTRGIEDGYDCGIEDFAAVHLEADFVSDFELPWE